jgi:hypothetical protein
MMRRLMLTCAVVAVTGLGTAVAVQGCGGAAACAETQTCFPPDGAAPSEAGHDTGSGGDGASGGDSTAGDSAGGMDSGMIIMPDGEAGCPAPATLECNGVCVNPSSPSNCGSCGHVCEAPEGGMATCTLQGDAGVCGEGCMAPTSLNCGGGCVDPTSAEHCGSCTNVCSGPPVGSGSAVCTLQGDAGVCSVDCGGDAGTTQMCGGSCYAPTDLNHCGNCTTVCAPPMNGTATCGGATPACGINCSTPFHEHDDVFLERG